MKILEALFLCGASSRAYLCDLLSLSLDEIAEATNQLLRTSLLNRRIGEEIEKLELSLSVKDLLLTNPKNIAIREEVLKLKNRMSAKAKKVDKRQKELSNSKFHKNYIPQGTNQNLKILLEEFHRCGYRDFGKQTILIKKFESHKENYKGIAIFHRNLSRILSSLKDFRSAISHAKKAISLDNKDPLNHYTLADCYFMSKDFEASSIEYCKLADNNYIDPTISNKIFATSSCHGLFQSLLYTEAYDEIIERTIDWEVHPYFKGLFGGYRATAFKRIVGKSVNDDQPKYTFNMLQALNIMDTVFSTEGYTKSPCIQVWKIFEEIVFTGKRTIYVKDKEYMKPCLSFVSKHLTGVLEQTPDKNNLAKQIILSLRSIAFPNNPFKEDKWSIYISDPTHGGVEINEAKKQGLTFVKIYHIPDHNNFVFAKDKIGLQYFLHKDCASDLTYEAWNELNIGTNLGIIIGEQIKDKAIPALDIQLIKDPSPI